MWLEDEIDVGTVLADSNNDNGEAVLENQMDDLIKDKLYAFHSYNTYAQLDFQVFYIDMYLSALQAQIVARPG